MLAALDMLSLSRAQELPDAAIQAQPVPADLREQVSTSAAIGRLLYVLDNVAAIGTDALLAEVPDLRRRGIAGYIPVQESGDDGTPLSSFLVYFYTSDAVPRIAYIVHIAPNAKPVVETFSPPRNAQPAFVTFVRARELAIDSAPLSGQPVNPVLVPGEVIGEHGILVYLLAGTTEPNVVVLGRHTRVLISDDGARVLAVTPLTRAIIEAPTNSSTAALTVTQVTADYPLETQVFSSLLGKLPIYVSTERGAWRVDGDSIAFLGELTVEQ